jgi:hypothetical protein
VGDSSAMSIVNSADAILTRRGDTLSAAFRRMCERIVQEEIDLETSLPSTPSKPSHQLSFDVDVT